MASRFQSRLVGTIILVALGVIILPDLLDGKKSHYQDDIAAIPLKPESSEDAQVVDVADPIIDDKALPDAPISVVEHSVSDGVGAKTKDKPKSIANVKVVPKASSSDSNDYQKSAWIIQLMALKNADNANQLVVDLRRRGFTASTKKENGFTRILIGPDVSKEKLDKQLLALEKITGAKGQLIKFKPLNP
jgi:DedD protein